MIVGVILAIAMPFLASAMLVGAVGLSSVSEANIIANPSTVSTVNTANSEHLMRSVSKFVTKQKPNDTPLDTFLRTIGKTEKVINRDHKFETVTYKPFYDQLGAAFTAAGDASDASVALTVDNPTMWDIDDVFVAEGYTGGDSNPLQLHVTAVGASTITVTATNGIDGGGGVGQRLISLADNTYLRRIGTSKSELDARHATGQSIPVTAYNYVQHFMTEISRSEFEAVTRSESGYGFNDRKYEKIWDLRSQIEFSMLFGVRSSYTVGSDTHYTMGGVANSISQEYEYGPGAGVVSITSAQIIDMLQLVSENSAGSENRILLAGSNLVSALDKVSFEKNVMSRETEVYHGVSCTKLISSHLPGGVRVVRSKTLNNYGWSSKGLLLDLDQIVKGIAIPMKATKLNLREAGVSRVQDAVSITEDCTVSTRYGGAGGVHAIVTVAP